MERVVFIFVDGCGIGRPDNDNPFFMAKSSHLPFWHGALIMPDGTPLTAIDATLGIPGPPQSASGQTALFCGATAREMGHRHRNGYPDRSLRKIILKKNLLLALKKKKIPCRFLNAYPVFHDFFTAEHVRIHADGRFWFSTSFPPRFKRVISATTCMQLAAGDTPLTAGDIVAGKALYQDFSNRQLIGHGLKLPEYSPDRAAQIICSASRPYAFSLYEYFQTDIYAHRRTLEECLNLIRDLDAFVGNLLARLDKKRHTLLLTSDHGNLEEYRQRGHNRNPVPLLAWGLRGEFLRKRIHSLSDVAPAILALY